MSMDPKDQKSEGTPIMHLRKSQRGSSSCQKPPLLYEKKLHSLQFSDKVLSRLNKLRQSNQHCDFKIKCGHMEFPVHCCVMAACSDYFSALFATDMVESQRKQVEFQGLTPTGVAALVEFAYSGDLIISLENLEDVLLAASHLQVNDAVQLCSSFMREAVTVHNCIDLWAMCDLYSLEHTSRRCIAFVLDNFEKMADQAPGQYMKMSHSQLADILADPNLKVSTEYHLFELVIDWIHHDLATRKPHTAKLMFHLRLPLMTGEELVEKVSKDPLMQEIKECSDLVTEAKDYHIMLNKQPLLQTIRTQVRCARRSIVICHAENLESFDIEPLPNVVPVASTSSQANLVLRSCTGGRHAFLRDAPMPLYNPCMCVVDNFLYCCGGKYDGNENNDIATARCFRYDPRFDSWFEMNAMNEARKDFTMVQVSNGRLLAVGGQDENLVMSSVESFSINENEWRSCRPLGSALYGHAAATAKIEDQGQELVFVSGGQKFEGYCNNLQAYNPQTDDWIHHAPMQHSRSNHCMEYVQGALYVLGGNVEDGYGFPIPVTIIERFDISTLTWTVCTATLNMREAGSCVHNGEIFIVGGINGQHYYSDMVQCFDPGKGTISYLDKFPTRIYGRACSIVVLPPYI